MDRFGRASLLGTVFPFEAYRMDLLVAAIMLTPTQLGYYSVAVSLSNLPRFVGIANGLSTFNEVTRRPESRIL